MGKRSKTTHIWRYFYFFFYLELAYVAYEGITKLFGLSTLDHVWMTIKFSAWSQNKIRTKKLLMEHEELKDTLTVEQKINIQSIKDSENTLS